MLSDPAPRAGEARTQKVSDVWGRHAAARADGEWLRSVAWAEHPLTARHINKMVSGDPSVYWIDWAVHSFLADRRGTGLSLGCGTGYLERHVLERRLASRMEAIDISPQAIDEAQRAAGTLPVTYRRGDLNTLVLEEEAYDFVLSAAALHHVTDLEHCLCQVRRSLKPGGVLIVNEFVGPVRFQWTDAQLDLANRVYAALPERYRMNHLTGLDQDSVERRPVCDMIRADPSEAVRSDEIIDLAESLFERLSLRPIGGSLLHPLLEGVIGNFTEGDLLDDTMLRMMIDIDAQTVWTGVLEPDFVVWVGRKTGRVMAETEELMRAGMEKQHIIARQEDEILALAGRLEEADERARALAASNESLQTEIGELKRERETMLSELEALKSTGPFKAVRFLKARMGRKHHG